MVNRSCTKWLSFQLHFNHLYYHHCIGWLHHCHARWLVWYAGFSGVEVYEILISGIIIAVVSYACITSQRLGAVAAIGALGFSMALIYVFFSAPDLAITQILIETLTVIMLVFVLFKLPRFQRLSSSDVRWRDAFVAIVFGGMMTLLVMTVTQFAEPDRISDYLIENSYVIAKDAILLT